MKTEQKKNIVIALLIILLLVAGFYAFQGYRLKKNFNQQATRLRSSVEAYQSSTPEQQAQMTAKLDNCKKIAKLEVIEEDDYQEFWDWLWLNSPNGGLGTTVASSGRPLPNTSYAGSVGCP